jgi:hypothetical protein
MRLGRTAPLAYRASMRSEQQRTGEVFSRLNNYLEMDVATCFAAPSRNIHHKATVKMFGDRGDYLVGNTKNSIF